jgi:hypothetical protein
VTKDDRVERRRETRTSVTVQEASTTLGHRREIGAVRIQEQAHRLDQASVVEQLRLVLDIVVGNPGLDLVSKTLELLYLCLQIQLELFFLCLICGSLHLVVYALEKLDALRYLLEGPVDFG